jgi:hypothetical protein
MIESLEILRNIRTEERSITLIKFRMIKNSGNRKAIPQKERLKPCRII